MSHITVLILRVSSFVALCYLLLIDCPSFGVAKWSFVGLIAGNDMGF